MPPRRREQKGEAAALNVAAPHRAATRRIDASEEEGFGEGECSEWTRGCERRESVGRSMNVLLARASPGFVAALRARHGGELLLHQLPHLCKSLHSLPRCTTLLGSRRE